MRALSFVFSLIALFVFSCGSKREKTLHIFTWAEYFDPKLISKFEQQCSCKVVIDTYDSNESMYAKLKLSRGSYDLIVPSNYYLHLFQKQKMIRPIDGDLIPNIALIDPKYVQLSDELLGVPFVLNFSAVAYRSDRLKDVKPTWAIFNHEDFKGRMTMLNDYREVIGAALKTLGYSINTKDPKALLQANKLLQKWKQNLAKFDSEQYRDGLATKEFLVVQGFSNDIAHLILEDENIGYFIPEEGASLSIDYMAIPKTAENPELAHKFINFFLDPRHAALNMSYNPSFIPVIGAFELVEPKMKKMPLLFLKEGAMEKMELIEDVNGAIKYYYQTWDSVKGG